MAYKLKSDNPVSVGEFFDFVKERQRIWHKKEVLKLPYPWTDDEVLRKYQFCNAYRELDRCSQVLIENVIDQPIPLADKVFNIILFRRFNRPEFYKSLGFIPSLKNFNAEELKWFLNTRQKGGHPVFNTAYTIHKYGFKGTKVDAQIWIAEHVADTIHYLMDAIENEGYEDAFYALNEVPYTGGFLAAQYLCDISYIPHFIDLWEGQIDDFCHVGPGAIAALEALEVNDIHDIYDMQRDFLGDEWNEISFQGARYHQGSKLRIADIQNCLCEFRKYLNYKTSPESVRHRIYKQKERT